jgi:ferric-dicitrate binding protein FerR (iron transport regulator)
MSQNNKQKLEFLLKQWATGSATEEEVSELVDLLKLHHDEEEMVGILASMSEQATVYNRYKAYEVDDMIDRILQRAPAKVVPMYRRPLVWVAAASVILLLAAAWWLFVPGSKQQPEMASRDVQNIKPGHSGAVLTLADGTQIVLDSTTGTIANEGGVAVVNDKGAVSYSQPAQKPVTEIAYNTVSTPNGRQYQLTLQDGSRVWLNAGSSIRFPTAFTGKERIVDITGEAYFEVKHNAQQPFKVHLPNGSVVEDIGTSFNINSYADEDGIKTTLIEGTIAVSLSGVEGKANRKILKPGDQAIVNASTPLSMTNNPIRVQNDINLSEVTAWKNGVFQFSNASIESIMRQVARWYDVHIQYEDRITQTFNGKIPRSVNVDDLFKILESTGWVHFKIQGRKITVLK